VNDRLAVVMRRGVSSSVDGPGEDAMLLKSIWERTGNEIERALRAEQPYRPGPCGHLVHPRQRRERSSRQDMWWLACGCGVARSLTARPPGGTDVPRSRLDGEPCRHGVITAAFSHTLF
jgi:hypothetical protein